MRAQDVMTWNVVAVEPGTPIETVARRMVEHRISGVPVVEPSGRLLDMITDGNLYQRAELATDSWRPNIVLARAVAGIGAGPVRDVPQSA